MKVFEITLGCLCLLALSTAVSASCEKDGKTYKDGDTIKDACSTCTCTKGTWKCIYIPCILPQPCENDGKTYKDGDTIKKGACTICTCTKGTWNCLNTPCILPPPMCKNAGKYYMVGEGFYDKCNECICSYDGKFKCTTKKCVSPINCVVNPCRNGGVCVSVCFGVYKCICPTAVYGDYCEIDPCDPNPCPKDVPICNSTGYGGYCCKHPCKPNPCRWGEGCKPTEDGYCCRDPCKPNPCLIGKCYAYGDGMYKCQGCVYNGVIYGIHRLFKIDDCAYCVCRINGTVSCDRTRCATCKYKGKTYKYGAYVKIDCHRCRCDTKGWTCPTKPCPKPCVYDGKEYKEGAAIKQECNTCTCHSGVWECTEMICPTTQIEIKPEKPITAGPKPIGKA